MATERCAVRDNDDYALAAGTFARLFKVPLLLASPCNLHATRRLTALAANDVVAHVPRYAAPNIAATLPSYRNGEQEFIHRTFHVGNYDQIRHLPVTLKEHQVRTCALHGTAYAKPPGAADPPTQRGAVGKGGGWGRRGGGEGGSHRGSGLEQPPKGACSAALCWPQGRAGLHMHTQTHTAWGCSSRAPSVCCWRGGGGRRASVPRPACPPAS